MNTESDGILAPGNLVNDLIRNQKPLPIPMPTSNDILHRMTPERVANVLEAIAERIRNAHNEQWSDSELKAIHDQLDATHLRQIADWLEKRIADGKAIDQDEQVQAFLAGLRKEAQQ